MCTHVSCEVHVCCMSCVLTCGSHDAHVCCVVCHINVHVSYGAYTYMYVICVAPHTYTCHMMSLCHVTYIYLTHHLSRARTCHMMHVYMYVARHGSCMRTCGSHDAHVHVCCVSCVTYAYMRGMSRPIYAYVIRCTRVSSDVRMCCTSLVTRAHVLHEACVRVCCVLCVPYAYTWIT